MLPCITHKIRQANMVKQYAAMGKGKVLYRVYAPNKAIAMAMLRTQARISNFYAVWQASNYSIRCTIARQ